ncbi:C1 peptidase-like protein [Aureococcus anophagefferens]|nr:C1 peptidase-like protein [Aureococcus anophagefferens]
MNMGCDGGYPFAAMQYAAHFGGLVHLEDYEYKAINEGSSGTPSCDTATLNSAERDVAHAGGWQFVAMGDKYEKKMPLALVKNGPLSVSFNANGMEFYVEGIVGCTTGRCKSGAIDHEVPCDPDSLDHAVLIVGYGVQEGDQDEVTHMNDDVDWEDDDINYWVIKNPGARRQARNIAGTCLLGGEIGGFKMTSMHYNELGAQHVRSNQQRPRAQNVVDASGARARAVD